MRVIHGCKGIKLAGGKVLHQQEFPSFPQPVDYIGIYQCTFMPSHVGCWPNHLIFLWGQADDGDYDNNEDDDSDEDDNKYNKEDHDKDNHN